MKLSMMPHAAVNMLFGSELRCEILNILFAKVCENGNPLLKAAAIPVAIIISSLIDENCSAISQPATEKRNRSSMNAKAAANNEFN